MDSNVKLSIILPVYNGKDYLARSVEALRRQSSGAFEALFCDDGSTDGSAAFCRECFGSDRRFRVVESAHRGSPAAMRNLGLREAAGEYVYFADSDDELVPDAVRLLCAGAEHAGNPDVLGCRFEDSGRVRYDFAAGDGVTTGSEALAMLPRRGRILVCNSYVAAYRRKFLLEHELFQDETLSLLEDNEWLPRVVFAAGRVAGIDDVCYRYIRRPGSVSTAPGAEKFTSVARVFAKGAAFYRMYRGEMNAGVRRFWCNHVLNAFFWYFFHPMYAHALTRAEWYRCWREARASGELGMLLGEASRAKKLLKWPLKMAAWGWRLPAACAFRCYFALAARKKKSRTGL